MQERKKGYEGKRSEIGLSNEKEKRGLRWLIYSCSCKIISPYTSLGLLRAPLCLFYICNNVDRGTPGNVTVIRDSVPLMYL